MRTIVHRKERPISIAASGALLAEGVRFNDEIHRLRTGNSTFIPKGLYRFTTHAEANQQQLDCLTKGMAKIARERINERNVADRHILERAIDTFRNNSSETD